MENPAHWTDATRTVDEAVHEWEQLLKDGNAWTSLPQYITNKLKEKSLLQEPGLRFVSSNPLRGRLGPAGESPLTVKALQDALAEAAAAGHSASPVCFDAEARTFDCHYVDIDMASADDPLGDGSFIFILSTRYH